MDGGAISEVESIMLELERRRAQESFLHFYMRMTNFEPPAHMRVMAKVAQAIEQDKIDRLMVFAPPRHAKTLTFTTLLPAWVMGRNPTSKQMGVVHTERFAKKIGRNIRNMLLKPEWPWPDVTLSDDSKAKEAWSTAQGGEFNGFGAFGGNQHGNPAEWLFMDDLIKGRKIALSPHMREEAWETYKTDLLSRLEGRAKQVMVFTRWHQDDPAGRILPENFNGKTGWYRDRETGEPWYVLCLPAVAEHENDPLGRAKGDWLWPERFGEGKLGGMQKRGGWIWSSLYQQRPSPEEGLMFTAEHIQRYDPDTLQLLDLAIYIASDYAVTAEAGADDPDYTVHQVWGVDSDTNIYLLDMWRGRTTADRWVNEWIRLVKKWKPLRAFEEKGQIISGVGPFLKKLMHQERIYVDRVGLTSSTSKEQRAQSLLGMASMGKMFLPKRDRVSKDMLVCLDAFESELLQFPAGKHDDTVDPATLFARGLDRIIEGTRRSKPQGERRSSDITLDDVFAEHDAREARKAKDGW